METLQSRKNPFITNTIKDRDKEIIQLLADGNTVPEIAKIVYLADRTLETRIQNVRARIGAKNTPHLIALSLRHNFIN